jgi:hypothetical protein
MKYLDRSPIPQNTPTPDAGDNFLLGGGHRPWIVNDRVTNRSLGMTTETDVKNEIAISPGAELAALFSNRFYVIVTPQTTRLVFSEGAGGVILNHHTAIVMPTTDAIALGKILSEMGQKSLDDEIKAKTNG